MAGRQVGGMEGEIYSVAQEPDGGRRVVGGGQQVIPAIQMAANW